MGRRVFLGSVPTRKTLLFACRTSFAGTQNDVPSSSDAIAALFRSSPRPVSVSAFFASHASLEPRFAKKKILNSSKRFFYGYSTNLSSETARDSNITVTYKNYTAVLSINNKLIY